MSATQQRCIVCNSDSNGLVYCSDDCERDYNTVMDDIADAQEPLSDEEWESIFEHEPPYLDDYYAPYKREWLD